MAASLADQLKKRYPSSHVNLHKGAGGVFEVFYNDNLIFSKRAVGRFPSPREIFDKVDL